MPTLVCFHAHPDDEATSTGGTIARAKAEGHRVVVVIATDGRCGETPPDLGENESLVDRRRVEADKAAVVLGTDRVVFLGYEDSGMTGWEQNANPAAFCQADIDQGAALLAEILREERADVLTVYDWHGNYGHPDHIQVHRVGIRAAELAGVDEVFEATMNRDAMRRLFEAAKAASDPINPNAEEPGGEDWDVDGPADDGNPVGTPETEITHSVDVRPWVMLKREALRAHASQVGEASFFLQMPDEMFSEAFGTEWFVRRNDNGRPSTNWLFES
ncbi:MAG: PIG-L family deacetylase [Actinomycetota bacterium]|nr:PIG-L family deacetylase [Actinomycetota bacterium]